VSVTEGRETFNTRRPTNTEHGAEQPIAGTIEGVQRSAVAKGRALFAATRKGRARRAQRTLHLPPPPTTGGPSG
jgi:hypothetical protein